jgi:hypothetical protein
MKTLSSGRLLPVLQNLINEANESLVLTALYIDFEYRSKIKECISKAAGRNVEITFYIRAGVGKQSKIAVNFLRQGISQTVSAFHPPVESFYNIKKSL